MFPINKINYNVISHQKLERERESCENLGRQYIWYEKRYTCANTKYYSNE